MNVVVDLWESKIFFIFATTNQKRNSIFYE